MSDFDPRAIRALAFDVFGTVVDWRASIVREGEALAAAHGWRGIDWPAFADAWRAGYQPAIQRARSGEIAWTNVDGLHRMILDTLLPRFGLEALDAAGRDHLNRVWHRLDAWPDAAEGLTMLKSRYVVSTLSNGNIALLVNMAKRAGLPWDCVLSAELMRHYKPDPGVYQGAARLLGIEARELLMVAAHPSDLRGAQRAGLPTALVRRPHEYGPNLAAKPPPDALPDDRFDIVASDFVDLARQLGA
ncbi:MAG TPA: haloacid dehalogenase type II [Burkholderiaceae bacterium]|nr:haloacid dehalogenase type II [Burkholderiaceae bacterium]